MPLTRLHRGKRHERVRVGFAQRSTLGEAWRSRVRSWLPSTTSVAPGVLPWSSPKREPLACVQPPRSSEARRPVQVAAASLGSCRLGPGSRAVVPWAVPRSFRGMNELGKAHPAGEARWVRREVPRPRPVRSPRSALAEASEANHLATCTGPVQRELRGPVSQESTLRR
jgi:hypothetical protein